MSSNDFLEIAKSLAPGAAFFGGVCLFGYGLKIITDAREHWPEMKRLKAAAKEE